MPVLSRHLEPRLLGSKHQEITNAPRVAPFVVVPCNNLDELLVQHNTPSCVEDGTSGVADKVGGDHGIFGMSNDALEIKGLGRFFQCNLDCCVGCGFRRSNDQVHDRNVNGRNTEGKTTRVDMMNKHPIYTEPALYSRQLAVEGWNDLVSSLGGSRAGGNDLTERPPRQSLEDGPTTVFGAVVVARVVLMRPSTMPNLSLMTLARGARQLVVQEALEITVYLGSYLSRLTPQTNMGASADGAEMMTFFAPPFK